MSEVDHLREIAAIFRDDDQPENASVVERCAVLRANLERLAARWEDSALWEGMVTISGPFAQTLRRVLSGETPPDPGGEWPATHDASLTRPAVMPTKPHDWRNQGGKPLHLQQMGRITTSAQFDALAIPPKL